VAFLGGVELLIHDAMYTPEELEEHRGWGHSTFEEAVALAGDAGVKRLVLFHMSPSTATRPSTRCSRPPPPGTSERVCPPRSWRRRKA